MDETALPDDWRPGATDHFMRASRDPAAAHGARFATWRRTPPPFWMTAPSVRIVQIVDKRDDGAWLPSRSLGGDTGWC